MARIDRGRDCRPEACRRSDRKTGVKVPHNGEGVLLGFLSAPNPLNIVAYLKFAGLTVLFRHDWCTSVIV